MKCDSSDDELFHKYFLHSARYCLVRSMLPLDGSAQLNAAAIPIIPSPLTVAVTTIGHDVGTLGCSVKMMELPLAEPVIVRRYLAMDCYTVTFQDPDSAVPFCASVTRPVPATWPTTSPTNVPKSRLFALGEARLSLPQLTTTRPTSAMSTIGRTEHILQRAEG